MLSKKEARLAVWYIAVQVVIWAKCVALFLHYGFGRVAYFNYAAFPLVIRFWDFWFHEAMHVAIGILALLFGSAQGKWQWGKIAWIVVAAVALHNLAYWFTASMPSLAYIGFDFARDFVLLYAAIAAGYAAKVLWKRIGAKQKE